MNENLQKVATRRVSEELIILICTENSLFYSSGHICAGVQTIRHNLSIASASCFQLIRQIIACITAIYHSTNSTTDNENNNSCLKQKPSSVIKDTRADKNKKEAEVCEDTSWKPWDLIWPKENNKPGSLPVCNSYGKYGVKLFWLVSCRP